MRKYLLLLCLMTLLVSAKEEWKPIESLRLGCFFNYNYQDSDYNIRKNIEYFELRKFLFQNGKQLSKKYIPFYVIQKKPLSSYSRKIISVFQQQLYSGSSIKSVPYDLRITHSSDFYFEINGYLIKSDDSIWTINEREDILWVFDGIDTEAELATFLWLYDSFNEKCKYLYNKTVDGYKVKKIETNYPRIDDKSKRSFEDKKVSILNIKKDGKYTVDSIKKERKWFPYIIPHPIYPTGINKVALTAESILDGEVFITPMKEFYLF